MHVLISGASGLIGSHLVQAASSSGHHVTRLVRRPPSPGTGEVRWDPAAGILNPQELEGMDAVVHLSGESLDAGRWTQERKARLRESRVRSTSVLCGALARLGRKPRVLATASAVGYYGDRGDETLREEGPPGLGFLPTLARDWEAAAARAAEAGIRVVNLRMGIVLSASGGALRKMLPLFRLGLGGRLGSGRQFWSWIQIEDVGGAFLHALRTDVLHGAVNAASPNPVRNAEFTSTLGRVLGRPTALAVPPFALRVVLGEMADEALLSSARAAPARLQSTGFVFRFPRLEEALRHTLGR